MGNKLWERGVRIGRGYVMLIDVLMHSWQPVLLGSKHL